jgi:DNA uptake protein ComE-like DNA-binding protein
MRIHRACSALLVFGLTLSAAGPSVAQEVAKRAAKRSAKEATESAAKQAAEDAAKKAAKKAMAPDALDLNTATPEQLGKLGLDEATAAKVVAARPFASLDDPKLKEAIPAEALTKLQGKVTVKAPAAEAAPAATAGTPPPAGDATPAKPPYR